MQTIEERVAVYHAAPLCKKCDSEVSRIQKASEQAGTGMRVTFSLWKRIKYGLGLLSMPVVVIDNKPFSVLGAFGEETLISELKRDEKKPMIRTR
jgi:hypothetical protein